MKYRLSEGFGECFYYVGIEDGGYPRGLEANDLRLSLNNLNYMAQSLKATATIAKLLHGAHGRAYALAHVRRNCVEEMHYVELRVAGVLLTWHLFAIGLACSDARGLQLPMFLISGWEYSDCFLPHLLFGFSMCAALNYHIYCIIYFYRHSLRKIW
jgi:hypothetical protein